jgi:hypothetical protein
MVVLSDAGTCIIMAKRMMNIIEVFVGRVQYKDKRKE